MISRIALERPPSNRVTAQIHSDCFLLLAELMDEPSLRDDANHGATRYSSWTTVMSQSSQMTPESTYAIQRLDNEPQADCADESEAVRPRQKLNNIKNMST
ncbi:unnamed protein product [Echinostoma caproni]|uniref:Uncharacterized protein n=1 Tax=Echinostoma caproni TaxID=27848 RepID=A0A183AJ45_9TREM|nr:unnamed protein product [Echinostoma caproni]